MKEKITAVEVVSTDAIILRKSRETNLGLIQSTYFTTHFKVLSWGCLSKATCSLFPSTDIVSVSRTGAVYRRHTVATMD